MTKYQIYKDKQDYMSENFKEVSPREFYEDIFNPEEIERRGCTEDRFSNPIIAMTDRVGDKKFIRNEIVFRDMDAIDKAKGNEFAVCSLCSFSGRRRTAKNAYKLHGICIDLDGVGKKEIATLHLGVNLEKIPAPTYVVNSGNGVHVYYIFENPVPLYPKLIEYMQRLKTGLTYAVWTKETSSLKPQERQFQGIYQGFRIPGSCTKIGKGKAKSKYPVTAYKWWRKVNLDYLNEFVWDEFKIPIQPDYASYDWADEDHLTLDKARELYPEWYEKRIVKKLPAGRWVSNKGLYYWWLNRIQEMGNARDGNRYNCISVLFIMGVKCNIGKDFVMADALELVEPFNQLTVHDDNEFTVEDVISASKYYKDRYARYSINAIEAKTGIRIERRPKGKKRLKQAEHVKIRMNGMRDAMYPNGEWRNKDGRPTAEKKVSEWQKTHPNGKKADCIRDTGLDKKTVYKWWKTAEPVPEPKKCGSREMTPSEKEEYNRLAESGVQMTLDIM